VCSSDLGQRVPVQAVERAAEHRRPVFELTLKDTLEHTYYLRLASQTSMATTLRVWQPEALLKSSANETFFWGSVFGAYLLGIAFYAAFWLWTREKIHLLYTLYVAVNFLAAFFTGAWPWLLMPNADTELLTQLLGVWVSLPLALGALFSVVFMGLDRRWPRTSRYFLAACWSVSALGIALVLTGGYRQAMPLVQGASMLAIVLLMFAAIYRSFKADRTARFFLFAFSFFYAGVIWRYLLNIGWLEPSFWNDNSYQMGAFIHMVVMSIGIFASYNRLRRDKQLAEARVEAESRQRQEQREFMAMMSHEFRTPLTIVSASVENLLNDAALGEKALHRIHKIRRANERMAQLMENYLSNERLLLDETSNTRAPCDLAEVCRLVKDDLADAEGCPVSFLAPPALRTHGDKDLIRIALLNLVTNARRHNPPDKTIEVEPRARDRHAEICVRDQGPGVSPDDIDHIFKRFFRGRSALDQPGAGLGLYLVRSIAQRHDGSVTVANRPEGGCEFFLRLPIT